MLMFSVLMPCYNVRSFVEFAIESVVQQTYRHWEIVIVDDGSTDGTLDAVDAVLRRYSNYSISVIQQSHKGCTAATKCAINHARGDICTVLDGDDLLTRDSLEVIREGFRAHPKVGFLWTRWKHTGDLRCWTKDLPRDLNLKEALLSGWWGAQAQRAFRRGAFLETKGLDPSILLATDLQLAALFAELGCDTLSINKVTYIYRSHRNQSSRIAHEIQSDSAKRIIRRLRKGGFARAKK